MYTSGSYVSELLMQSENENSSRTMNHKLMHTRHATLHMHAIIILLYVLQGKIRYVHMNDHASTYQ